MQNVYYYYTVVVLISLGTDLDMRASAVCHVLGGSTPSFFCRVMYPLHVPKPQPAKITSTSEDYLLRISVLIDRDYIVRSVARSAKRHVAVGRANVRE